LERSVAALDAKTRKKFVREYKRDYFLSAVRGRSCCVRIGR
jgi:hypothetical protein